MWRGVSLTCNKTIFSVCKKMCALHIADQCLTHSSPQSENREGDEEGRSVQSKNLTQTLLRIYDIIVSHKGTSVGFINRDMSQKAQCDYQHS